MTTSQLIALLFPVAGAATAIGAGLLAKWIWVDRPRRLEAQHVLAEGDARAVRVEQSLIRKLRETDVLVNEYRVILQRAPARNARVDATGPTSESGPTEPAAPAGPRRKGRSRKS
jgi:hypothetical protein